jgi:hypothetical protein
MAYSFTPPILYLFNIYASYFYIFVNSALHDCGVESAQTMSIRTTSTSNNECANIRHTNNKGTNNEEKRKSVRTN